MKVKIDFGRVFPRLLLFLVGIVLLVGLALVALAAFLFSFVAGSGVVLAIALELTIVPGLMIVAGVATILTGVSWWGDGGQGWFSGIAMARASEDRMRLSARVGEVIGVVVSTVVLLFLYENQLRGVAFFAPSFGPLAGFYFYGPLLTGIVLSLARAAYGHRNGLRPFDALNAIFLTMAAFWLLSTFPFDFARLGDMFPSSVRFLFGWLGNSIGRILFFLAGVGSSINFIYTTALYFEVRHRLHIGHRVTGSLPSPTPAT